MTPPTKITDQKMASGPIQSGNSDNDIDQMFEEVLELTRMCVEIKKSNERLLQRQKEILEKLKINCQEVEELRKEFEQLITMFNLVVGVTKTEQIVQKDVLEISRLSNHTDKSLKTVIGTFETYGWVVA